MLFFMLPMWAFQAPPAWLATLQQKMQKGQWNEAWAVVLELNQAFQQQPSAETRKSVSTAWEHFVHTAPASFFTGDKGLAILPTFPANDAELLSDCLSTTLQSISNSFATLDIKWDLVPFAKELYERAQKICTPEKHARFMQDNYIQRGNLCYYTQEPLTEVEAYYQKACDLAEQYNTPNKAAAFRTIAFYYYGHKQDMELAEVYQKKVLSVVTKKDTKAETYGHLADIYAAKGDQDRALEYLQRGIQEGGDTLTCILQYAKCALIYLEQGQYALAEQSLEQAHRLRRVLGTATNILSWADRVLTLAFVEHRRLTNREQEITMQHILILMRLRSVEAYPSIIQLLSSNMEDESYAATLKEMYEVYVSQKQSNKSIAAENRISAAWGDLAFKQGDYQTAIAEYDYGLQLLGLQGKDAEVLKTNNDRDVLHLLSQKALAQAQLRRQNPQAVSLQTVYESALKAIQVLDKMRQQLATRGAKERLLQQAPQLYETAIGAAWELYEQSKDEQYLREAFSLSEKSRAILLLDALKEDDARRFGGIPDSLRSKEKALLSDIAYLESEMEQARRQKNMDRVKSYEGYLFQKREQIEQLKKQLEAQYPQYFKLKYQTDIPAIETFQSAMSSDMVLVEYFMGKSDLYVFALSKEQLWGKRQRMDTASSLAKTINTWLTDLYDYKKIVEAPEEAYQAYHLIAHSLYQWLLADAVKAFPTDQYPDWILIPDGVLSYIPFEMLLTEAAPAAFHYNQLPYFLRKAATSYHYSATLWLQSVQNPIKAGKGILALAAGYAASNSAPESRSREWGAVRATLSELLGAKEEVEQLQQRYNGLFFYNEQATEANFKQHSDQYGILHFAMHGVVNQQSASRSGLFFTENADTVEDNILMAYEIPNLRLRADLVVLSACETARGKYQSGEGVMSMGRSFMYAGANSVMMTLWEVNDVVAKRMIESFYRHLEAGLPKHKALQKAKLEYLESSTGVGGHPFFWSPYILLGNTQPTQALRSGGYAIWIAIGAAVVVLGAALALRRRT